MASGFSLRSHSMHRSQCSRPSFSRSRFSFLAFSQFHWNIQSRRSVERPAPCIFSRRIVSFGIYRADVICSASSSKRPSQSSDLSLRVKRSSKKLSESLTVLKSEPCAKVEFQIKFRTDYGNQMKMVGSAYQFGSWAVAKSPSMKWNESDVWSAIIELPIGSIYEYKYVVTDAQGGSVLHWQQGNNCVLAIGMTDREMVVSDNWEGSPGARVTSKGKGIATKEERLLDWAEEIKSTSPDSTALVLEHKKKLEKAQEESRLIKEEASKLKSELRMASLTKQAAEQQVKELERENRRLMGLLSEQQDIHRTMMEQTLTMLADTEIREGDSDIDVSSEPSSGTASVLTSESPILDTSVEEGIHKNGSSSGSKSRRPKRKPSQRRRRSRRSRGSPQPVVPSQG